MSVKRLDTAITQLFSSESKRHLIQAVLDGEIEQGQKYRIGELADSIGKSKNSIRPLIETGPTRIGDLVLFGVFEPTHEPTQQPNIPHYRVRDDSPVVELLEQWDGYPLFDLFHTSGSQDLVSFFLLEGDGDAWSFNQIQNNAPITYHSCRKYMDMLVESGLVTTEEGTRTTRYRLDTDSEMWQFLAQLNTAIMDIADEY